MRTWQVPKTGQRQRRSKRERMQLRRVRQHESYRRAVGGYSARARRTRGSTVRAAAHRSDRLRDRRGRSRRGSRQGHDQGRAREAAGVAADEAGALSRVFFDPRKFSQISRAYWSENGPAMGRSLHHWLIPQRAAWVPQGIRNAGFNLVELPALRGAFHPTLGLNQWMGFARNWGPAAARQAAAVENAIAQAAAETTFIRPDEKNWPRNWPRTSSKRRLTMKDSAEFLRRAPPDSNGRPADSKSDALSS